MDRHRRRSRHRVRDLQNSPEFGKRPVEAPGSLQPQFGKDCDYNLVRHNEEYLAQKQRIQGELDSVQRQLTADGQQGNTWIEGCERFFTFTQGLTANFANGTPEEKQAVLFLICSKLTLRDRVLSANLREPFASLAGFPLAGKSDDPQFEPPQLRSVAEKPKLMEAWLGILDAIRTALAIGPAYTQDGLISLPPNEEEAILRAPLVRRARSRMLLVAEHAG